MATKLSVQIVGDASGVNRAFSEAQTGAEKLSGKFSSLAGDIKNLALGFAGLGAAAGAAALFKDSIQRAESFDAAVRSLNLAIKSSGENVNAYRGSIDQLSNSGAKLGYTNTDVLGGLKTLTLVTGNATDAVKYMGLAEDIAKAKGIDLSAAATAVGKAIDGKTTALQRYGIVVAKGEPIEQALADAQKRYAGQAAANTTVTQQLSATVADLETKIGQALLPAVQKIATAIEAWIGKSQNQKKITDDVRNAVNLATSAFDKAKTAIQDVDKVTGGFKNTLEDLLALKVVATLASWTAGLAGSAGVGAAAYEAEGKVAALKSTLLGMAGMTIGVGILIGLNAIPKSSTGQSVLNQTGIGFAGKLPVVGGLATQAANAGNYLRGVFGEKKVYTGPSSAQQALDANAVANLTSSLTKAGLYHPDKYVADTHGGSTAPGMAAPSYGGGSAAGGTKAKKAPAFKIPAELEQKIRDAQVTFGKDITKQHLDTLVGLYNQEKALDTAHGKANPDVSEIAAAEKKYNAALSKQQVDAAKAAISKIEAQSVGPSQVLKLAQAAGAPAAEILADQQNLENAYTSEASQLKAKLAAATGAAKTTLQAALTKVRGQVTSAQDSIVQSLQSIAQTAQSSLQSLLGTVESAADQALGAQYYQGGQTPAEAQLAAMQAQDTQSSLAGTLASAKATLLADTAAKATAAQIVTDKAAVAAAQRAIVENNLSTLATKQRAAADSAYSQAVYNLNSQINNLSTNAGDGSTVIAGLNKILAPFGIQLGALADPGGNGILSQLTASALATAGAFNAVTVAAGGKPSGPSYGKGTGSTTVNVTGTFGSVDDVTRAVQQGLIQAGRRNGGNVIGIG